MNKKHLFTKALAAFMAFAMVFGTLVSLNGLTVTAEGVYADAANSTGGIPEITYSDEQGKEIVLGKDAYLNADGTYSIELSAFTTGAVTVSEKVAPVPTDYIFVLDGSGSMTGDQVTALRKALRNTLQTLRAESSEDIYHRAAFIQYAGNLAPNNFTNEGMYVNGQRVQSTLKTYYPNGQVIGSMGTYSSYYFDYVEDPTDGNGNYTGGRYTDEQMSNAVYNLYEDDGYALADTCINNYSTGYATHMDRGLKMARDLDFWLRNNDHTYQRLVSIDEYGEKIYETAERNRVIVVFSDGAIGSQHFDMGWASAAIQFANDIKVNDENATIFTISLVNYVFYNTAGRNNNNEAFLQQGTFGGKSESGSYYDDGRLMLHIDLMPYYDRASWWNSDADQIVRWWDSSSPDYDESKFNEALQYQRDLYDALGLQEAFLLKDFNYLVSSGPDKEISSNISAELEAVAASANVYYTGGKDYFNIQTEPTVVGFHKNLGLPFNDESNPYSFDPSIYSFFTAIAAEGSTWTDLKTFWYYTPQGTTMFTPDRIGSQWQQCNKPIVYRMRHDLPAGETIGDYDHEYIVLGGAYVYKFIENLVNVERDGSGAPVLPTNAYDGYGYVDENGDVQAFNMRDAIENSAYTFNFTKMTSLLSDEDENSDMSKLVRALTSIATTTYVVPEGTQPIEDANLSPLSRLVDRLNSIYFDFAEDFDPETDIEVYYQPYTGLVNGKHTFADFDESNTLDGALKFADFKSKKITVMGIDFSDENVYCHWDIDAMENKGYKVIVRINNILANDDAFGHNLETNIEAESGLYAGSTDARPSTFPTDGGDQLLFPVPSVSIRTKYIVYDYGFKLTDDDLPGFFSENEDNQDVAHVLSIDYLYNRQRKADGTLNYHNEYPYVGARGLDADGDSIENYTAEMVQNEIFKVGFDMDGFDPAAEHPDGAHGCTGYFEPHSIARRDYVVSALLKLNDGSYEWSKLTFIPATNVLYEAEQGVAATATGMKGDFAEFVDANDTYAWSATGMSNESTQEHYNILYGYDPAYNDNYDCDANGSAMMVTVDQELYDAVKAKTASWPVAKFTFEGSGFSFMSRCALDTGIFILDVVPKGQDQKYNNTDNHPATNGYEPVDGDNYHTLVNTRYYGGTETPDGSALLHQIPVFRRGHMPYQDYDVYLTPVYYPAWANDPTQNVSTKSGEEVSMKLDGIIPGIGDIEYTITNAVESDENAAGEATRAKLSSFTSYVDSIRIYHPRGANVHKRNIDALEYYHAHEMNSKYVETRELLIHSIQNLAHGDDEGNIAGAIFIDYGPVDEGAVSHFDATNPDTYKVDDYVKFGPNNEMYLKGMTEGSDRGGSFSFALANPGKVTNLHLSMKAHESTEPATVTVTLKFKYTTKTKVITVASTTEMYYDLLEGLSGFNMPNLEHINIACTGSVTLSIVNLKIVYEDGYTEDSEVSGVGANIGTRGNAPFNTCGVITTLETVEFANAIAFGVKGDANGDNAVDMTDALLIMRKAMDESIEFRVSALILADVNGDDAIDLSDALSAMRLAMN